MSLSHRDSLTIWHPYTQMKLYGPAVAVVRGEGAYLFDEEGKRYIDAIASWWTNLHGHSHPYIAQKVYEQLQKLEHVIFAGFTHEPAVMLAERLLQLLPGKQEKIFFSDNGSTAVEVALKMAFQYWHNRGEQRTRVIAFKNAYHGDTFGAMSVGARGAFTGPFEKLLFDVLFIDPPVPGREKESLAQMQSLVEERGAEISSFIFEPLVQGTAGMVVHDGHTLSEMIALCRAHQIITIGDEVMTGFGRTGKLFACSYLTVQPDIFCLSKGITGGAMAFGVTSCTQGIYDTFLSDDRMKTFFHGHSYTANPLACAAANASLDLFEKENTMERVQRISRKHATFALQLGSRMYAIADVRQFGTILALEIKTPGGTSYFNTIRDRAYHFFLEREILIRPLGNVIYLMPPYCISDKDLDYIYQNIVEFIELVNG